jgi:peptidoglycan/LPS O-acetylase OafA/YrhL
LKQWHNSQMSTWGSGIKVSVNSQVGELSAPEKTAPERIKLDSLTALRFFAAAMVVVSHAACLFHFMNKPAIIDLPLAQGVSFFFVLSGFILTYNYPELSGIKAAAKFWRARLARVWPAHAFALLLGIFVFDLKPLTLTGVPLYQNILAHFAMVHGWILQEIYFFSINPPSWSISTEFAFYLLFPLLIWKQKTNWWAKLIVAAMVVVGFMAYGSDTTHHGFSVRALMYINPLVRVFEFVLGMSCATLWMKFRNKEMSPDVITALEVGCIALIAAYIGNISHVIEPLKARHFGAMLQYWLLYDGNCFAFAALIFLCALQKGHVAKLLSNKVCVYLGEISYSIYLLHMIGLVVYMQHAQMFSKINSIFVFAGYCAVVIGGAHLTYTYIEKPLRKKLAGRKTEKVLTTGDVLREAGIVQPDLAVLTALTALTAEGEASGRTVRVLEGAGAGAGADVEQVDTDKHPHKLFAHIPFLDGLRALAIFWVLNFHSGGELGALFSKRGGWAGVDAFFVISGFLITGILLKEQTKTATIGLKNFYTRRALRLVPAYILFIIVTCIVNPLQCKHLAPAVGIAAIYMCDFDLALGWGHILGSGFEITWSLSVEEKFYLIWPTVMKFSRKHLAWIGLTTIAACFAWRAYLVYSGAFWLRIAGGFDTKVDALMIGCLAAVALHNPQVRAKLQKYCTHFLVPIALFAFVLLYLRALGHPFGAVGLTAKLLYWNLRVPVFTVAFTALIMSLCLQPKSIVARFFSLAPFTWIGKISYSLYLWHMLAFAWVMQHAFVPGKSAALDVEILEYAMAIAFAAISYYFIEQPFLKIKDRFSVMAETRQKAPLKAKGELVLK